MICYLRVKLEHVLFLKIDRNFLDSSQPLVVSSLFMELQLNSGEQVFQTVYMG
jgi:hypothetical protein